MQLMIKPSLNCQFKCDFCSANKLCQSNVTDKDFNIEKYINTIRDLNPDDIIITGGDPLLLPIDFFNTLLSINDKITLSLTTNLWDFYIHPDKWVDLFKNPRVGICTSFQYGDRRKKPDGTPYTEEDFIKVETKFNELIGYTPNFIAVISKENEDRALDHVYLAKRLGTECKLNGMLPVGLSTEYYPRYKMVDLYCKIVDLGLEQYESNTKERFSGKCPYNTEDNCFKYNRSMIIDINGNIKFSYCEDLVFTETSFNSLSEISTEDKNINNELISETKCLSCELYRFCNGCKVHRMYAKSDSNYCGNMTKYISKLKKYGFKI